MTFRKWISKAWDLVALKHFHAEQESSLSLIGCSNCDRAPFDTKARLESRSSLSVYTKSVSILPVNVPVSCKSLMSLGNTPFIKNLGHCYFCQFFFIFDCLCWHQNCWSPWCAADATQWVDGFAFLYPELYAGNKSISIWKKSNSVKQRTETAIWTIKMLKHLNFYSASQMLLCRGH